MEYSQTHKHESTPDLKDLMSHIYPVCENHGVQVTMAFFNWFLRRSLHGKPSWNHPTGSTQKKIGGLEDTLNHSEHGDLFRLEKGFYVETLFCNWCLRPCCNASCMINKPILTILRTTEFFGQYSDKNQQSNLTVKLFISLHCTLCSLL